VLTLLPHSHALLLVHRKTDLVMRQRLSLQADYL